VPWSKTPRRRTGRMVASATDAGALTPRVPRSASRSEPHNHLVAGSSPASANRFPGAIGIVFDFPWLCRRRRGISSSLSSGIGQRRQKCHPGLWPLEPDSYRHLELSEEISPLPYCFYRSVLGRERKIEKSSTLRYLTPIPARNQF
jgi:hypothetical protein